MSGVPNPTRTAETWRRGASLVALAALALLPLVAVAAKSTAQAPEIRLRVTPLDASGLIPVFIADGAEGSRFRSGDAQLARWAFQEWERRAAGIVRFQAVQSEEAALVRVRWLPWAEDAALGHMDPSMIDGRVRAFIDVRPDEERFRPSIRRRAREDLLMRDVVLYFVCLHEIGHALGLSHSDNPRDIMWPGAGGVTLPIYERYRHQLQERDDIPKVSWLSDDDVARFRALQ